MLARFGPFTEIAAGSGWMNLGGIRYLWQDVTGPAELPQLIISTRQLKWARAGITVQDERLVMRLLGSESIIRANMSGRLNTLVRDALGDQS
jgi:hypothetical protein